MPIDARLAAALRPFERRAVLVAFVRAWLASLLAAALVVEFAVVFGVRNIVALVVLASATVVVSAMVAARGRPTPVALARRIDARARLNDLVVTSLDCGDDGMAGVVRRMGVDALARETPRAIFPFEPPAHWRRWLAAAAAAQMVAIPLAVRAPALRAPQSDLTSLTMPSAGSPAAPPRRDAPNSPSPTPAAASSAQPAQNSNGSSRAGLDTSSTPRPDVGDASGSGAGDGDRLRLAARSADADIAAGRVPIARRAIVEKYFAAIQSQKERHR